MKDSSEKYMGKVVSLETNVNKVIADTSHLVSSYN